MRIYGILESWDRMLQRQRVYRNLDSNSLLLLLDQRIRFKFIEDLQARMSEGTFVL